VPVASSSIAPSTVAVAANSPISFEQPSYTLTMAVGTTISSSFFLKVASGFNETVNLRVPTMPTGVNIRFEPNPTRNLVAMSIAAQPASLPVVLFYIEAYATSQPSVLLARTSVLLFITGTTTNATAGSTVPTINGDPNAAPGVIYGISPSTLTATRGGDAVSAQIDFVRQGNFAGPVEFQVTSPIPPTMSVSFQSRITQGNRDYIFVSAGANTPVGTYTVTFDAVTSIGRVGLLVTVVVR
jgi:hypothetical protein